MALWSSNSNEMSKTLNLFLVLTFSMYVFKMSLVVWLAQYIWPLQPQVTEPTSPEMGKFSEKG